MIKLTRDNIRYIHTLNPYRVDTVIKNTDEEVEICEYYLKSKLNRILLNKTFNKVKVKNGLVMERICYKVNSENDDIAYAVNGTMPNYPLRYKEEFKYNKSKIELAHREEYKGEEVRHTDEIVTYNSAMRETKRAKISFRTKKGNDTVLDKMKICQTDISYDKYLYRYEIERLINDDREDIITARRKIETFKTSLGKTKIIMEAEGLSENFTRKCIQPRVTVKINNMPQEFSFNVATYVFDINTNTIEESYSTLTQDRAKRLFITNYYDALFYFDYINENDIRIEFYDYTKKQLVKENIINEGK